MFHHRCSAGSDRVKLKQTSGFQKLGSFLLGEKLLFEQDQIQGKEESGTSSDKNQSYGYNSIPLSERW